MAGSLYSLATEIAVLAGARLPEWTTSTRDEVLTAIPSGTNGLALNNRMATHIVCDLRTNIAGRTAYIAVGTLDLTATYTVTIDGTACAYDATSGGGAADVDDVLEGIAAAITASASALVTASADLDAGEVVIRSIAYEGMAITAFSATGTGVLTCEAEPQSADLEVYAQAIGLAGWRQVPAFRAEVGKKGHMDLVPTAGLSRLALRPVNLAGAPADAAGVSVVVARTALGPAKLEPAA